MTQLPLLCSSKCLPLHSHLRCVRPVHAEPPKQRCRKRSACSVAVRRMQQSRCKNYELVSSCILQIVVIDHFAVFCVSLVMKTITHTSYVGWIIKQQAVFLVKRAKVLLYLASWKEWVLWYSAEIREENLSMAIMLDNWAGYEAAEISQCREVGSLLI